MRRGVLETTLPTPVGAEQLVRALSAHAAGALAEGSLGLVWLDSGVGAREGSSLIALGTPVALDHDAPVLPQLRDALRAQRASLDPHAHLAGLPLGLVGWFGYELLSETMALPGAGAPHTAAVPPAHRASWLRVDRGVLLDHASGEARLVALESAGASATELDEWRDEMLAVVGEAARASIGAATEAAMQPATLPAAMHPVRKRHDDARYAELVERCQRHIREGDAYQLCLTTQHEVTTLDGSPIDPIETYVRLRGASSTHHGALLMIGGTSLLSASPETFLRVSDGVVQTRPIKGTRPRGALTADDVALAAELAASEKERAENLMIVDLMRNDLQRICEVGSVRVTGLLEVESYAHVHQLVSTIEGTLQAGIDALDAVASCLPAGSMTGAPKRRAVELLHEIEGAARGIYSGAFGYFGVDGGADLAMVIRSIVLDGAGATIGAGGGITALSDPTAETAEMRLKAAAMLRALGAA